MPSTSPTLDRRGASTFRRIAAAICLAVGVFVIWLFWPLLVPLDDLAVPDRGDARITAAGAKPGCSPNAVLRLDLGGLGIVADGKRIVATEFRARDGCTNLDQPLVAFNWFTLEGLLETIRMRRYQMYALRRVSRDAQATSVVFNRSHPVILAQPKGQGPASGQASSQPWVPDEATMPFYPSARALLQMLDANRADYFAELEGKRAAMRTPGYFGWQLCLMNCVELAMANDPANPLLNLMRAELRGPLLVAHTTIDRGAFEAHVAELDAAVRSARLGRVAYAGWTIADPVMVAEDGSLHPPLQTAHWHDATLMIAADAEAADTKWTERVRALPAFVRFEAAASRMALLFHR